MVADIEIAPGSAAWLRLANRAKLLAALTLLWLAIEGAVGVVAGVLAGSIALIAFGLDSAIESLASVIIIWRFTGTRTISADAERRAQKWVAISFFLLTPYVAAEPTERESRRMVAPKSLLEEGSYSGENWLPVQPLGKRALHPRLIRLASLIAIVLVSLVLWVAISEAVISIASVR